MDKNVIDTIVSVTGAGVPVLLVGPPGVGKTEVIKSLFDYTEVLLLSAESEESLSGLPYREGSFDLRTIPAMFKRLQEAADKGLKTCLFLDELDKASRSVSDTLLTLVATGKMGEAQLPKGCAIVAAANPPEMGGGDGISCPMLNRMVMLQVMPDKENWVKWATTKYKGTLAESVIELVDKEVIPLFESVGDGLSQRITSARSLDLAMKAINNIGLNKNAIRLALSGILTPDTASRIMNKLDFNTPYKDVLEKAVKLSSLVVSKDSVKTKSNVKKREILSL